jgi:hypothetical protein
MDEHAEYVKYLTLGLMKKKKSVREIFCDWDKEIFPESSKAIKADNAALVRDVHAALLADESEETGGEEGSSDVDEQEGTGEGENRDGRKQEGGQDDVEGTEMEVEETVQVEETAQVEDAAAISGKGDKTDKKKQKANATASRVDGNEAQKKGGKLLRQRK